MTMDEVESQDYRAACKRCFTYIKNNCKEEILPELVDYLKGYRIVVLEEFLLSLIKLPSVYIYPVYLLEYISIILVKIVGAAYRLVEPYTTVL